jgi:hypothetical protein
MKLTKSALREIIREEIYSLNETQDYLNKYVNTYVKPAVKKAGGKDKFFKMPDRERRSFIIDFLKNDLKLSSSFIKNMTYNEDWEADFYAFAENL